MSSFIADFRIDSIELVDIAFTLNPKGPSGPVRADVKLDHDFSGISFVEERECYVASVALFVTTEIVEEGEAGETLMSAHASLHGSFSFDPFVGGPSEEEVEGWILQNGISALYAHARSQIAFLASGSPVGRFFLPPIYVQEYLAMRDARIEDDAAETAKSE